MQRRRRLLLSSTLALWVFVVVGAEPVSVKLSPKEKRCVWTEIGEGQSAKLEVFVLSGGKLKVKVEVAGPFKVDSEGSPVVWDESVPSVVDATASSAERQEDAFASPSFYDVDTPGAYRACLTNKFDRFEDQLVSLEWHLQGADVTSGEDAVPVKKKAEPKNQAVAGLAKEIANLRADLANLQDKQRRERRRLAHHRAINDASHNAIVEGSLLETTVYIFASLFQIIFVRRWFDGKGVSTVFGHDNV